MTLQEIIDRNERVYLNSKFIHDQLKNSDIKSFEEIKDFELFYRLISSLSAQAKAPMSEKYMIDCMGWKKVSAKDDRGDAVDSNKIYYELKNSFTNLGENLNLRQIRLWQDVDYYFCFYIDEVNLKDSLFFLLTKKEMEEEILLNGSFTHGVKEVNMGNIKNEYSLTIPIKNNNNKNTQRWKEKYLSIDIYNKVMECQ